MATAHIIITLLAVLLAGAEALDEDFAFDIPDGMDAQMPSDTPQLERKFARAKAVAGKLFHYQIPEDAWEDKVLKYEILSDGESKLPSWIFFDTGRGIFRGIPDSDNTGSYNVIVTGFLENNIQVNKEFLLLIEVDDNSVYNECSSTDEHTVLTLNIAKELKSITPKQRMISIVNIAKLLELPESAFTIKATKLLEDENSSLILAGPGTIQSRQQKSLSSITVTIGCDGHIWENISSTVHSLNKHVSNGTIAEVLRLPLVNWQIKKQHYIGSTRNKRDIESSGDDLMNSGDGDGDQYYNYDDFEYSDNDDYEEPKSTSSTSTTTTFVPTEPSTTSTTIHSTTDIKVTEMHPHRHHHGETQVSTTATATTVNIFSDVTLPMSTTNVTTSTTLKGPLMDNFDEEDDYDDYDDSEAVTIIPTISATPELAITTEPTTDEPTVKTETVKFDEKFQNATLFVASTVPHSSPITSEDPFTATETSLSSKSTNINTMGSSEITTLPTSMSTYESPIDENDITVEFSTSTPEINETTEQEVITKQTTLRHVSSTSPPTTRITTEAVIYEIKNFPPTLQNRLNKVAATAGKYFSYFIPNDTFTDVEDGNDLQLEFLDGDGREIKKSLWCQFNKKTREVYGLPMEIDVSRWTFTIKATDSEGGSVADTLEILVQHHKSKRAVNHEFSLYVYIEKKWEFPYLIDYPLKILHALKEIFHAPNLTEITVRNVEYHSVPVVFTWTNDSLPKHYCPKEDLENIFKVLSINDNGEPTHTLIRLLAPQLKVKKIAYKGLGVCELKPQAPISPPTNFSPILRNPVDHIDATVGKLLVYKVPDDTFYDPEDTDPRNLQLNLLTVDRQPIPENNWLHFDEKNKEFYGVPLPNHIGSKEYHLLCRDSGGLSASDSLVVQVHPVEKLKHNVEFKITLLTDYEKFIHSAALKRMFIEKIQELFGDKNTDNILLKPTITRLNDAFIVSWYNTSLVQEVCPREEIQRLGSILVNSDRTISSRVQYIMDADFPVSSIQMEDLGSCKRKPTDQSIDRSQPTPPVADEAPSSATHDEYLVTFIVPAIIIAVMLILAGVFACVLYRRRRTGKMNVDEDGSATYGNKGIPVIFQEELEEKPESGTKAPIILKDEKPPLAPPEYSKSGSLKLPEESEPYHPPPPMVRMEDNGRQARPKPTPTYRKPPPYVPP